MRILIIGSCRNNDNESKSQEDKKIAEELGKELALRGHEIITGGAGGLQGHLASSYKRNNGKKWTAYLVINEEKDENRKTYIYKHHNYLNNKKSLKCQLAIN